MTNFGCENGGVPRCRQTGSVSNDGPFGAMDPIFCQSRRLTEWDFIKAKVDDEPKCICKNGVFPLCSATGGVPTCPDGSRANRDLTKLPPFLGLCASPPSE